MKQKVLVNSLDNSRQKKLLTRFIDISIFIYILSIYILSFDAALNLFSRILALLLMAILAAYVFMKGRFNLNGLPIVLGAFFIICLASCIWAVATEAALSRAMTVGQILILIVLLHNYLSQESKFIFFLNTLIWTGTIFAAYVVLRIGITAFLEGLESGLRLGGEINNVNAIGIMTAMNAIMSVWQIFYQKKHLYWLNLALSSLVCLASGSRNAIICLLAGLVLLFFLKGNYGKKIISLLQGAAIIVALLLILQLPAFDVFTSRIEALFDAFFSGGSNDTSVSTRLEMIVVGFQEFLKSPIIGHGIGYSTVITLEVFGRETYLHNNYVELLSSVGLVGTLIYYALYFTPIKHLFGYVKKQNAHSVLLFTILLMFMLSHIGGVDYYDKIAYLYILAAWLCVSQIKSENETEVKENVEENQESA